MANEKDKGGGGWVFVLIAGLLIWHWTATPSVEKKEAAQQAVMSGDAPTPGAVDSTLASITPNREFDEDAAREAARDSLVGLTYEVSEGSSACTDDCGGHNAGWQQAQEEGASCGGSSSSFDEGCEAYGAAIQRKVDDAKQLFDQGDSAFEKKD